MIYEKTWDENLVTLSLLTSLIETMFFRDYSIQPLYLFEAEKQPRVFYNFFPVH